MNDSLGDRIKSNYEDRSRNKLVRRTPVIMRIDGRAFHTLTKGCVKPFDEQLSLCMLETATELCKQIQGAKLAYVQSDEISILITDFDKLETDAWFDYNIQKMCSIAASIASVKFTQLFGKTAHFDCRVFNIPKEEVCNYFIWRQKDWERNSLQMLARATFSAKQLHKKGRNEIQDMLDLKGISWLNLDEKWKNGSVIMNNDIFGWYASFALPFVNDRNSIDQFLEAKDETNN